MSDSPPDSGRSLRRAHSYEDRREFLRLLTGGIAGAGATQLLSCIYITLPEEGSSSSSSSSESSGSSDAFQLKRPRSTVRFAERLLSDGPPLAGRCVP